MAVILVKQNIFNEYINKKSIFKNKHILTTSFTPIKITHRNDEIYQLVSALAPALKGYQSNNILIYGPCGTGKTICTKFVMNQLNEVPKDVKLKTIYINSKMGKVADTEYRLFAQILREFGESVPDSGLPTNVLYRKFFNILENNNITLIVVLDEIDTLFNKVGDEFLYNLTRINSELKTSRISIIGITNDLSFREKLDQRVKSSLSDEEILFKPYNAIQLKEILEERVHEGFEDDVVTEDVVARCAALAAHEHGDARRALDLLRVAGEIAERVGEASIIQKHVDLAEEKIDLDRVTEAVKNQPTQSQLVLYSIMRLERKKTNTKWTDSRLLTGDIYNAYSEACRTNNTKPLTQRRVSDLLGELDMLGIITTNVISKGRYGRTREIAPALNQKVFENVEKILLEKFS